MDNFKDKLKRIIGAAAFTVAGVGAGMPIEAQSQGLEKPTAETTQKSVEAKINEIAKEVSKKLFAENKKSLELLGVGDIEIIKARVSKDKKFAVFIMSLLKKDSLDSISTTEITINISTINKYSFHEIFSEALSEKIPKAASQTATSQGGVSINATGNSNVSIGTRADSSTKKQSISVDKGRVFLDGKDVTPEGVSGNISVETKNGQTFINGKPVKKSP